MIGERILTTVVFTGAILLGGCDRRECCREREGATVPVNPAVAEFVPLFPDENALKAWHVTEWSDLAKPAAADNAWSVKDGILNGSTTRGTWLVSDKEYSDFILEYDFKLGERGNSGLALRTPMRGDPAFDGMELQMADFRYNTQAKPYELTGALYRALAPNKQVYKPTEWNSMHVELIGRHIKAVLNGEVILDHGLSKETSIPKRHDNSDAPPLKDRPLRGHIGFQELTRGEPHAMIRNARIKEMTSEPMTNDK